MRDTLFQAIVTMLKTLTDFQGSDGTERVYDYPLTSPAGYPYVVVGSDSLESVVLDNARDSRRYQYKIQIVGEKFGDPAGVTQSNALQAMRKVEDNVVAAIDANYYLGLNGQVIRSFPTKAIWGTTDSNSRIILDFTILVDTMVNING
jgi:hypothetical protein